jgi:glycosyltransferase involved in cell wall biosynthesis
MPELVRPGENGFLVASEAEAIEAVEAAVLLDRAAVRASVEHRFSVERMVDEYVEAYERVAMTVRG